jgi:3-phytase
MLMIRLILSASVFAATLLPGKEPAELKEFFFTPSFPAENIDSVATWTGPSGEYWLLATAKSSHSIHVYDGINGAFIRRVGGLGDLPGQFARPNGILVHGDFVFVVERDNHRVQVLTLPDFRSIGAFGTDELIKPYGLALIGAGGSDPITVYVTDNYETEAGEVPPAAELGRRVKVYAVELHADSVEGELTSVFGDTSGPGNLHVVESIAADSVHDRLLVADEDMTDGMDIKIYDLAGRFTGQSIGKGIFKYQPEGIDLDEQNGIWIATDQGKTTNLFHLFDRESLEWLGTFSGERTLNTDGICFSPEPHERFPDGLLFAVDDDASVAAFSWSEVLKAVRTDARQ